MTMDHAMVSVATGVLSPLLGKLSTILEKECSHLSLKGMRDEIVFLKYELSSMDALLVKLADMDDLDVQDKEWRNQVRDLSYDIDNCIDDFTLRVNRGPDVKGLFQKINHMWKTLGARRDIARQIPKLMARVDHVSKRRKRYNFDQTTSSSSGAVSIDPRLSALYVETKALVGMDNPKEELIKLLLGGEGESAHKLTVISVVGFGGSGKTTLAKQVYQEIQDQFECRAFISVSQKPDMVKIFNKILLQVKGQQYVPACEVQDLIDELRDYILDKRYFIVIDDLWNSPAWKVVRWAFPESTNSSRILTTTRNESLARECCSHRHEYIYKMKTLNNQDSRRLFFNRIFGSEDACPLQFKEDSTEILKRFGGLPLAIITIASLLASQVTELNEQWENVRNSLGKMCGTNPTLKGMMQILNLSYLNLPFYLKTCFLYLGMYPEDYTIQKDDLVRLWVAEGFVSKVDGQDVEDVAVSYFNELVNRSMIQPVYTDNNDKVLSCKVHDMMLDLIKFKCKEENFITIISDPQDMIALHDKVHRLSLHFDYTTHGTIATTDNLSQVRSLAAFGISNDNYMFLEFKHLRVLFLDFLGASWKTTFDLTAMGGLFHLRYFKVRSQTSLHLPSQIRWLKHLETFEIDVGGFIFRSDMVRPPDIVIPSDIVRLPQLLHLGFPGWTRLPNGIGKMRSLRTLEWFDLNNNSLENIEDLGELTNLRSLRICFSGAQSSDDSTKYMDVLCSSLGKIANFNLKYLFLYSFGGTVCCDGLSCLSPSPCNLQRLHLSESWFSKVPKWIGELRHLDTLTLEVRELFKDGIHILAELPALVDLELFLRRTPQENIVICGTSFPVLKHFSFICKMACLAFEAGAMPKLQRLQLLFRAHGAVQCGPQLVGIEHLSGLKEVYSGISGTGAEESEIIAAESTLRKAIDVHPTRPTLRIDRHPYTSHSFVVDKEDQEGVNIGNSN